jgi:pimeloyl-ACP methyl ester carboxylesterase
MTASAISRSPVAWGCIGAAGDDLAALTAHLDLHDAVHIGHSAGGGEVARYVGRHGESRVAVVDPATATRAAMLVANGTLKTYPGYPHGMPVTHADVLNPDLLAFIRS